MLPGQSAEIADAGRQEQVAPNTPQRRAESDHEVSIYMRVEKK